MGRGWQDQALHAEADHEWGRCRNHRPAAAGAAPRLARPICSWANGRSSASASRAHVACAPPCCRNARRRARCASSSCSACLSRSSLEVAHTRWTDPAVTLRFSPRAATRAAPLPFACVRVVVVARARAAGRRSGGRLLGAGCGYATTGALARFRVVVRARPECACFRRIFVDRP